MKLSKHSHSCLLIEEQNNVILIDPGDYTFNDKSLDITLIHKLDFVLITHEHADHMHIPFLKNILNHFPNVQIIAPPSAITVLQKEYIPVAQTIPDFIQVYEAKHEEIVIFPVPQNYLYTMFNKLTHPGDSFDFIRSSEILALPIQAPWGSYAQALKKAVEVKPKKVIPIHDWHWKDEARIGLYQRAKDYLKEFGIEFMPLENGQEVSL